MQSNHCRQTAAAAARFGLECMLVLTGELPAKPSANLLLDELFGAKIVAVPDRKDRDRILQETFDNAVAEGKKPYLVPYGGSSPTGALGYAFAMEELMQQVRDFRSRQDSEVWIGLSSAHPPAEHTRDWYWVNVYLDTKEKCWESVLMSRKNG